MKHDGSTLIFDLDGTLSDPSLGIVRSTNYALAQCGFPEAAPEFIRTLIGPPLDTLFHAVLPDEPAPDIPLLVHHYRERYARIGYAENTLYPGTPAMVQTLADAGIRLGVCTSKREDYAVRIVELFELDRYFAFVSGGDIGIEKSAQLRQLLDEQTIDTDAIMIGDRHVDLQAASRNNLRSIGVLWGFGERAELEGEQPWQLVATPEELTQLFVP